MDDKQQERLLQDIPTPDLLEHLAERFECLTVGYIPLIDPENIYTFHRGRASECEDVARNMVHELVDTQLPKQA